MPSAVSSGGMASAIVVAAIAGITANIILGASSLFWRALSVVSPDTLLCYRILVSLGTLLLAMAILRKYGKLISVMSARVIALHLAAALLVAVNWGTFIWASIHGHVVESGIGYLIAPIVAIGLGVLVLKDRLSGTRRFSIAVIMGAIFLLLIRSGELNAVVYLVIGLTWGGYAYIKKMTPLDAFSGLFTETAILSLILCAVFPLSSLSLSIPPPVQIDTIVLLSICGFVSVIPLWLFSYAAGALPLSAMGFFQFVLPTTQLVVAIVFYRQPMSNNTLICFSLIWAALFLIVCETLLVRAQSKP